MSTLEFMGVIQNNGGLLIAIIVMWVRLEGLSKDFKNHKELFHSRRGDK